MPLLPEKEEHKNPSRFFPFASFKSMYAFASLCVGTCSSKFVS